ncbi:hypothetical protein K449DRAFT_268703 [Hypoxylon sp. EC38]|nr:hypothetical protein K449DRAFT_268703 [Hypoxylon sp. EC38]
MLWLYTDAMWAMGTYYTMKLRYLLVLCIVGSTSFSRKKKSRNWHTKCPKLTFSRISQSKHEFESFKLL